MTGRQFDELLARWRAAPDDVRLIERLDAAIRENPRFREKAADFLLDERVLRSLCASPCRIRWSAFRRRLRDCIASTACRRSEEFVRRRRFADRFGGIPYFRRRVLIAATALLLGGAGVWLAAKCAGT